MKPLTKEEADLLYLSRTSPRLEDIESDSVYDPGTWAIADSLIERGLMSRGVYRGETKDRTFDTTTNLGAIALACYEASKT